MVLLALVAGGFLLNRSRTAEDTRLTHQDLRSFNAERISAEIAERGPVLFSDTTGDGQDFIVQHIGDDPLTGWSAFKARRPSQRRECFFEWRALDADATNDKTTRSARSSFVNTCDPNDSVDAEGSGLPQYRVTVDKGVVTIDISGPLLEAELPHPTTGSPTTESDIPAESDIPPPTALLLSMD